MDNIAKIALKFKQDLQKIGAENKPLFGPLPLRPPGRKNLDKPVEVKKEEKSFQKVMPEKLREFILFVNANVSNKTSSLLKEIKLLEEILEKTGTAGIKLALAADKVVKGAYEGSTAAKEELEPLLSAYLKLIKSEEDVLKRINSHSEPILKEDGNGERPLQILIDNINNLMGR
jgi:hypothetical protein